jgi:hypothetical protein
VTGTWELSVKVSLLPLCLRFSTLQHWQEMSDSPNVQEPKRKQKNEIASCYRLSSPYREGLKSEDHPQIVRKLLKNLLPIRIFWPNIWRTPNYLRTGNKINRLKIYLTDLNGYFTFTLVIHTRAIFKFSNNEGTAN